MLAANATAPRMKSDMKNGKPIASGALPAGLGQNLVHIRLTCPSTKPDAQAAMLPYPSCARYAPGVSPVHFLNAR